MVAAIRVQDINESVDSSATTGRSDAHSPRPRMPLTEAPLDGVEERKKLDAATSGVSVATPECAQDAR